MQLAAAPAGTLLASQTIDMRARTNPAGATSMWSTDRTFRLAGARDGIDTFTGLADAIAAASVLSAGGMPGLAVIAWRGGFRLHDVHTGSRTYMSTSPHGAQAPITRETQRSSVPFAAGNLRFDAEYKNGRNAPAVVRADALRALVDGNRVFVADTTKSWAGRPQLVETTRA